MGQQTEVELEMTLRGFEDEATGGGCSAYILHDAGVTIMVTVGGGSCTSPSSMDDTVDVGIYGGEHADTPVLLSTYPTLRMFLQVTEAQRDSMEYFRKRDVEALGIPVLPPNPTEKQVADYLLWLADSPYQYHIDDRPETLGFDATPAEWLQRNHEVMWAFNATHPTPHFLWSVYGPAALREDAE